MPDIKINVNMDGEQYIKYIQGRKFKLSKRTKQALPYFILSLLGAVVLLGLFINYSEGQQPPQETWYRIPVESITGSSWNTILKLVVAHWAPAIIILVGLAWVLHGFGFYLVR